MTSPAMMPKKLPQDLRKLTHEEIEAARLNVSHVDAWELRDEKIRRRKEKLKMEKRVRIATDGCGVQVAAEVEAVAARRNANKDRVFRKRRRNRRYAQ